MRAAFLFGAAVLAALPAFADDAARPDEPKIEGDARVGWRFLSGEGEGRFPQEFGLTDGPRLFDLNLLATDPRKDAPIDEIEARVSGVGDPDTDYVVTLRKRGSFEVSGGYRRDDFDYRASGDPFPYDTTRERTFLHGLWTPDKDFSVHFSWDGNDRRGEAFTEGYDELGVGAYVPPVEQRRTISQESDRFSLGADYAVGIFRFGLTQTIGVAHVDDSRFSDSPAAGDATRDTTRLRADSRTYATTGKAGVSLLDDTLDATLFLTKTRVPLDERATGSASGSSPPTFPIDGVGRLRRDALDARFETSWRPRKDWEFTFAGEKDDVVDDETGRYLLGATTESHPHARVADRVERWSLDATWDASDAWRFRVGEQYVREEVFVPTDTHFREDDDQSPTRYSSNGFRTTAGVDWKPTKTLSAGALAHVTTDDRPETTVVPDRSNDWSLRVKWKPSGEWSLTSVWRRATMEHAGAVPLVDLGDTAGDGRTTELGSAGRTATVSESAAWTRGPWTVRATASYRRFETSADSAFGWRQHPFTLETASFESRETIADIDARYEFSKRLRLLADVVRTGATGDYAARRIVASVGGEYDLRKDVTVGLTLSTWRFDDRENLKDGHVIYGPTIPKDGYRAYGAEVSVTYRF